MYDRYEVFYRLLGFSAMFLPASIPAPEQQDQTQGNKEQDQAGDIPAHVKQIGTNGSHR